MVSVIEVNTRQTVDEFNFAIRETRAGSTQPVRTVASADGSDAFAALGSANHVAVVATVATRVSDCIVVGATAIAHGAVARWFDSVRSERPHE